MAENIDMKASASAVSRIEWIDAVKGLGIILIMVSHVDCLPFELPLTAGYVSMFFCQDILLKKMVLKKG